MLLDRPGRRRLVIARAFGLATAHDAPARERAAPLGDDRRLAFLRLGVGVQDHHPIVRAMQLVGALRIGEERREMPWAEAGVQHREPSLAFGIEAPRRDPRQQSRTTLLVVLAVDVQQHVYAGL